MARPSFRTLLGPTWEKRRQLWVRYAWRLVGNEADAEDVVQDAACGSLRAAPDVEDEKEADAYMRAAIRSNSIRHVRQHGKRGHGGRSNRPADALQSSEKSVTDIAIQFEDELENERLLEVAMDGIEQLPAELREALMLTIYQEPKMTLREVAGIQGVSITAVRKRVDRALVALRTLDEAFHTLEADDSTD